ncbi:MAG TPA: asparagine synthase (glutamine-hydrolyzing) [Bryobacteraceae bacterium]|nr:asparagine synthase (glutamine-hydrolyzing) [Bryobacteraceae bacterium]
MCGIAGFVDISAGRDSLPLLKRMTSALAHRGPDDSGYYTARGVALGHRRLSIVDLSGGHQPMSNEDGSLTIVYNGEIFNHAALRPELERAGHAYHTRSDTETILHAYEQYGPECLDRFRGMFAFAVWDSRSQTLFCARDRLGIKPFYYYSDGRVFAFASEIKALLEHPEISPAFDDSLLTEYLAFGYTSGERTLFSGIRKLMPGHHLTVRLRQGNTSIAVEQYWDVPEAPAAPEQRDDRSWIADLRERLEETVRMRLMSDVPLGTFLSGGVDSSAITALVKQMSGGRVETFSVGYKETAFSELGYARQVAEHLRTDHHEVVVGMEDFFDALPRLVWNEDEPITWPSSVALGFVSKLASERVKVVLTGEGSDELFGGYARYRFYDMNQRWARRYGVLPEVLRRFVRNQVAGSRLLGADARRKLQHTFIGRGDGVESLYLDNFYSALPHAEQQQFLVSSRLASVSPYASFLRYWNTERSGSLLQQMLYADQKTYLVELLMKQDQMSMSASIESRVPLLDHTFVEFAARVPDGLKMRNGESKYIFKKAVEDLLPREIVYRKKMGFPTPLRDWLRDDAARPLLRLLQAREGLLAGYVNPARLNSMIERHTSGFEDSTDRIWRLLNLQIWGEMFITGRRQNWEGSSLFRTAAETVR